jgi:VanZ family protein
MFHFLKYQFPAILWAAVIFGLSSIPGTKLPEFTHLVSDKILHAGVYFVFGLLVYLALEPRVKADTFDWKRLLFSIVVVVLYGLSDEFHQGFVPGRTEDILDAAADTAGGLLAAAFIVVLAWRRRPGSARQ